ncbi:pyridoxamine kinase [Fusobacterium sp. oral taxon 370]|uniref:pyridoxamine kinase n=1 Tax=Fusobacterium sp. oral taxon 370 TaxID=712288 RepID=UPI000316C04C|nr:pyridoxamine kinase [Fusobacterium sp. oral taxon 370]
MSIQDTKVLLINDIAGYGKVALSAMLPILSYKGFNLYNLPTAIVSNTLNYEKFRIKDTTEYIEETLKIWKELNFSFDVISTGFIFTKKQMEIISKFCEEQSKKGVFIFNDPIMADNGELYSGVSLDTVDYMKNIISVSDVTMPNYTESCLLTRTKYKEGISTEEINSIINKIRELDAKSVIVTSIPFLETKMVAGFDSKINEYFYLPYEEIPTYFPGTGDIFSSVIISETLGDKSLKSATEKAMKIVKEKTIDKPNYKEHNTEYKIECIENLREKGIELEVF